MKVRLVLGQKIGGSNYMTRWFLQWRYSIRLHRWGGAEDHRDLHDHPWWFVTIVLLGGYEETYQTSTMKRPQKRIRRYLGWVLDPTMLHRVRPFPGTWTLVITGPRVRKWGYMTEDGWVDHDTHDNGRF